MYTTVVVLSFLVITRCDLYYSLFHCLKDRTVLPFSVVTYFNIICL